MFGFSTQIEIAAPPEKVREVFLDFPKMSSWLNNPNTINDKDESNSNSNPGITMIETASGKPGLELEAGDIVTMHLGEKTRFEAGVLVNSSSELSWLGSIPYIFSGVHCFQFKPSSEKGNVGGTTFVNRESFTGLLSPLMSEWVMGGKTKGSFQGFNRRLKGRVERLVREG